MRSFILKLFWLPFYLISVLGLAACDVSITPGGIEDRHAPKVIEGLEPLPEGVLDFAYESTVLFFGKGREGIQDRLHPAMENLTGVKWTMLEKFASDAADLESAEYYGHGFGEAEGIKFVVVQLKVPFEGGYNLVKLTMPLDEACCRVAGLEINSELIKSFKLGK